MVLSLCPLLALLLLLVFTSPCFPARTLPPASSPDSIEKLTHFPNNESNGTDLARWRAFERFLDASKGSNVSGMSELKKYFRSFGYLPATTTAAATVGSNFTDLFDEEFESAVNRYQAKLGLPVTGKLDSGTVSQIMAPRCGVRDTSRFHATKRYTFFQGTPKWSDKKSTLTYAFSPENSIDNLSPAEIKAAFRRAFARWSNAILVKFSESDDFQSADIKIAFYGGDHGDGEPFDGVLGVLAHAFSPENGRFHLDAAERWAVNFESEKSNVAVDLESVATHEIGHILGLGHTSVREAVMYPSLSPRTRKMDLRIDDVEGAQALYGINPNFSMSSLFQSEISTNQGVEASGSTKNKLFLGSLMGLLTLVLVNMVG